MQTLNSLTIKYSLLALLILMAPDASADQVFVHVGTGFTEYINLGSEKLSYDSRSSTPFQLDIGYRLGDESFSIEIQYGAYDWFGVYDESPFLPTASVLGSVVWRHSFHSSFSWLDFGTILGLGGGLMLTSAQEDVVPSGPLEMQAGAGVAVNVSEWLWLGLDSTIRVRFPAYMAWSSFCVLFNTQFRFDL